MQSAQTQTPLATAGGAAGIFQTIERLGLLPRFQKDFGALTGLSFDLVDLQARSSLRLGAVKRFVPFCCLIQGRSAGKEACRQCDCDAIHRLRENPRPLLYSCHMGLMDLVVPLVMGGQLIGVLASGQFLLRKPSPRTFQPLRARLRNLGVPLASAEQKYLRVPVLTHEKANAVVDLLVLIADHLLALEPRLDTLKSHQASEQVNRARQFIENHFAEEISPGDVAAAVHLSASRLSHLFREQMNTSLVAYRNALRLEQARFLLANTDLRVVDIALKSGFSNLGHFNGLFKRLAGLSPRQYRRQHAPVNL